MTSLSIYLFSCWPHQVGGLPLLQRVVLPQRLWYPLQRRYISNKWSVWDYKGLFISAISEVISAPYAVNRGCHCIYFIAGLLSLLNPASLLGHYCRASCCMEFWQPFCIWVSKHKYEKPTCWIGPREWWNQPCADQPYKWLLDFLVINKKYETVRPLKWLFSCSLYIPCWTSICLTYTLLTWLTFLINHGA